MQERSSTQNRLRNRGSSSKWWIHLLIWGGMSAASIFFFLYVIKPSSSETDSKIQSTFKQIQKQYKKKPSQLTISSTLLQKLKQLKKNATSDRLKTKISTFRKSLSRDQEIRQFLRSQSSNIDHSNAPEELLQNLQKIVDYKQQLPENSRFVSFYLELIHRGLKKWLRTSLPPIPKNRSGSIQQTLRKLGDTVRTIQKNERSLQKWLRKNKDVLNTSLTPPDHRQVPVLPPSLQNKLRTRMKQKKLQAIRLAREKLDQSWSNVLGKVQETLKGTNPSKPIPETDLITAREALAQLQNQLQKADVPGIDTSPYRRQIQDFLRTINKMNRVQSSY